MIAIVGGGICGLSIGWYLAQAGQPVTVLERGAVGREATWAAAGLIAPWCLPGTTDKFLFRMQVASHALWPDFARHLETTAQVDIDFRTEGRLFIILDHEDMRGLREEFELNKELGLPLEWLSAQEIHEREPNLTPAVTNGIFSPTTYLVDNRKVALALREAFQRAGGQLRENTPVQEIVVSDNRVQGVRVDGEILAAEKVVLAAGAWSSEIAGLPQAARPPVRPVKGQMLALRMPPDSPLLKHTISGPVYLYPRSDGRLLIGATVEEQKFDKEVTAGAVFELLDEARRMLPAIDNLPILETWAGLRPAGADNRPILGPTKIEGLSVATAHFKHGIMLAPITAQAISRLILDGTQMDEIQPFSPLRFAS